MHFYPVSEWYDNQEELNGNFRKLLQERIENANPPCNLTTEETKRLAKLETIRDKLKRGENVQNRQLKSWLSEDEYAGLEAEVADVLAKVCEAAEHGELDTLIETQAQFGRRVIQKNK